MKCLRCDGPMSPGYMIDLMKSAAIPGTWVIGKYQPSKFLGMNRGLQVRGKKKFHIEGYRCDSCGWLDLFASKENEYVK